MRERDGLDIGHECEGRDGIVSWCLAATFDDLPSWHGDVSDALRCDMGAGSALVMHQVRAPLPCIASMATLGTESWRFVARHAPIDAAWPAMTKGLHLWVLWNELAERMAQVRYRLEDVASDMPAINTRQHEATDWDTLELVDAEMAGRAKVLAEWYGYSID